MSLLWNDLWAIQRHSSVRRVGLRFSKRRCWHSSRRPVLPQPVSSGSHASQITGRYTIHAVFDFTILCSHSQHAGPKLGTYNTGNPSTTAVHFAHRSRRFRIRTVSQTQNEAQAMAGTARRMVISRFFAGRARRWLQSQQL